MPSVIRANSLYTVVAGPHWGDALTNALALGGSLVTINNLGENNFLFDHYSYADANIVMWIGLRYLKESQLPYWASGEEVSFTNLTSYTAANLSEYLYWNVSTAVIILDARNSQAGQWFLANDNQPFTNLEGIAELSLNYSAIFSPYAEEGKAIATTINISAGTNYRTDLVEGTEIYYQITGIDNADLDNSSPCLVSGSSFILNGHINLLHILKIDEKIENEDFEISIYSDASFLPEYQIGTKQWTKIADSKAPVGITLSSERLTENIQIGSTVAYLYSVDPEIDDSFTYSLAAGDGDGDNSLFFVQGNQLNINSAADFELKSSYAIRLRTTDRRGLSFEKAIILSVTDVNETPTDLLPSATSFNENINAGSIIASLTTLDQDSNDTFTYELVNGTGDADNSAFSIDGNQLKINTSPDFEKQSSYSIRLRSTDLDGLSLEKPISLSVNDLSGSSFNSTNSENLVGTLEDDSYAGSGINNTFNGLSGYDRVFRSGDLSNFTISGTAGAGGSALIESITASNNGKKAVNTATPLDTLLNVESIQINGGATDNTINAGGGTTLGFTRTAFNGTFIANGGAGVDTITGGTYKNWLAGRGFATGVTSGVETITGTTNTSGGSIDVFDLRNDALTGAAYVGGGNTDYAKIANFNVGTDKLVLSGQGTDYKFTFTQVTSGGKVKTVTDEYWAVATVGGDLIAQVRGNGLSTLTGFDATTAVLYGTGNQSSFGLGF